ncbi:sensor histidine kinase [Reyranella sp.]|uniref:sensor histidine kinase n=1 Tax=Reyranella sp. TaxID=1929291 RepID=UPI0037841406
MLAAWWASRSLRTKLLTVVALAFLPVIAVSATYTIASERYGFHRLPSTAIVVARSGIPVGAQDPPGILPSDSRLAKAIAAGQMTFVEYGTDGQLRQFHLVPIPGADTLAVLVRPLPVSTSIGSWAVLAVAIASLVIALLAVWFGADRWCIRPLRYIEDIAGRIVRGEPIEIARQRPQTLELGLMADRVAAMASALTRRETDLRAGLEQRDHLLRELQHRVKNNLQMIMSLLNLQAGEIRSPRIRRLFRDAQHRVLALSILHVHLYERSNWSLVDFQEFIGDVVRQVTLSRQNAKAPPLRYHIRASSLTAGPDVAIPVGLIVTETVNAILDSDASGAAAPEIDIEMSEKGGIVELSIADIASSTRDAGRTEKLRTFGMTLIRGLAMQLSGELHISPGDKGGLRFAVIFPMPPPPGEVAA